mmetsp:Transcript_3642/g.7616  ORF Transcript_3642/g.7616 Transcript_3642/m.7616 type:complete len:154 (-) Transcript_3642:47-508(-)
MTGGGGLELPNLRDLQPTDTLAERDEFGTIYKKEPVLPRLPGASKKGSSGSTVGGRSKPRTKRRGGGKSSTRPPAAADDNQFGSEEARAQEEWRENVRLRRMLGNANLSREQVQKERERGRARTRERFPSNRSSPRQTLALNRLLTQIDSASM